MLTVIPVPTFVSFTLFPADGRGYRSRISRFAA